jgi:hypothetical protein
MILFFVPFLLFAEDIIVTAQIEGESVVDKPQQGSITVTHSKTSKIDPKSFTIERKSLKTSFQKDIVISPDSPLIISIYFFEIPAEKKGLHILPEIGVKVGDKVYSSTPTTYEVFENKQENPIPSITSSPVAPAAESTAKVVLGLEAFVEGSHTLYPGQRAKVGYKYIFNYNFDLTKEVIPLLEAKGFRKIGDKVLKESTRDNLNNVEVSQVIEGISPGTFTFGPSLIQGKAYIEDAYSGKQYSKTEYTANAPPITIQVDPFPAMGKPSSFKGAIGEFKMDLSLLSPSEVTVGDKILLQISISGTGEIENVPMPDICCQPGFSGFFRQSDLPPVEKVQGNTKTFIVEMRPISDSIREIPALELSFFNPSTITYSSVKSKAIPLKVNPLQEEVPKADPEPVGTQKNDTTPIPTSAIEIEGNYPLTTADLSNSFFGTWWVLLIVPMGALALFLQMDYRNKLEKQHSQVKTKTSAEVFNDALRASLGSSEQYNKLREGFMLRLFERGDIRDVSISTDQLPKEGLTGEVRTFLARVEELRFTGKESNPNEMIKEAKILFNKLETA